MSNIAVTHADSGVMRATVLRTTRVSPHVQRVTLVGPDLARLQWRGFDQWVRLALPAGDASDLDRVPSKITTASYLRLLAVPGSRRPTLRAYTLRAWRPERGELDIDFVLHGDGGVAGPWAERARPGEVVALLDQGCGWPAPAVGWHLLVADETGLPAVAGILRDLPREARGIAVVELADLADAQEVDAPVGFAVEWVTRRGGVGQAALAHVATLDLPEADRHAFAVGASSLATGVRRHLLHQRGWHRAEVTFCGYWKD